MRLDDETTAWMIVNMYAGSLAAQVVVACDKARVRVTGRRIADALAVLVPPGAPAGMPGFDGLQQIVEEQVAAILSASARVK